MVLPENKVAPDSQAPAPQSDAAPRSTSEGRILLWKLYPISLRYVLKKSFVWVLLLIAALGIYEYTQSPYYFFANDGDMVETAFLKFSVWKIALWLVVLGKAIHAYLYRVTMRYIVDHHSVILRRGIILRQVGTYTFSQVENMYITRDWLDFLLGLYTLGVSSSVGAGVSRNFGRIEGLSKKNARGLYDHLQQVLGDYQIQRRDLPRA